jgi:hypothetical protein
LWLWLVLEITEGWHSWFQPAEKPTAENAATRPIARTAAAHS